MRKIIGVKKEEKHRKLKEKANLLIDEAKIKIIRNKGVTWLLRDIFGLEVDYNIALRIITDDKKIEAMGIFDDDDIKVELASTIRDDNKKIEAIELIKSDSEKAKVVREIKDVNKKLKALDLLDDDVSILYVIESIEDDDEKIEIFKLLEIDEDFYPANITSFIKSIKDINKALELPDLKNQKIDLCLACEIKSLDNIDFPEGKLEVLTYVAKQNSKDNIIDQIQELLNKIEIIKNLDDNEKLKVVNEIEIDYLKSEVIKTIGSDEKKFEAISFLQNDASKANVTSAITNDEIKLKVIAMIESDAYKEHVLRTINDEEKYLEGVSLFSSDEYKGKLIGHTKEKQYDLKIIEMINNYEVKKDSLEWLPPGNDIYCAIRTLTYDDLNDFIFNHPLCKENMLELVEAKKLLKNIEKVCNLKNDEEKIAFINSLENKYLSFIIISSISDNKKKIEVISELPDIYKKNYRRMSRDFEFIKENFQKFIEFEGTEIQTQDNIIDDLYQSNNEVVCNIDLKLLDKKYVDLLGNDKINLISCYTEIQQKVLNLDSKKVMLFSKCIDTYMNINETDEWTVVGENILNNLLNDRYEPLLDSIEDLQKLSQEDFMQLTIILQNDNWCDISNFEELRDYEKIREKKCEEIIYNKRSTIRQRKNAVLQKIFGHDLKYSKSIIKRFGEDIESIQHSGIKDYVRALNEIMKIKDPNILQQIYEKCESLQIDKGTLERNLKNEYCKLFNKGLYKIKEEDLIPGYSNVYDAGTDFKILMTSVAAFSGSGKIINYSEDWNRPAISTQHFCASYIRNDMIGTAPIHSICYGFSQMKEDSLMLSGREDIYSSREKFVSSAEYGERYYSPEEQINHTMKYNEMDFRRIQGGTKKQPDYILVFRRNGKIDNMEEAQRASKQWYGMPIVIVDIDKCLESEKKQIDIMIEEYKKSPNSQLAHQIKQKIRNNRVTDSNFCEDLQIEFTPSDEKMKNVVSEKELEENYTQVSAEDRKKEMEKIRGIYSMMKKIIAGEEYEK